MSTEIVLRSGAELAVDDEFAENYPAIAPDPEMAELLAETLGDEEIGVNNLPRIRVPAAGGTQWQVVRDGEETYVKELTGVLALIKPQRVFWTDPEPSGKSPDCSSNDGKRPISIGMFGPQGERGDQNPTGLCANCPMSQPGSDPNPKNRGAACKDQRLVFLVQRGHMFPSIVVAPPSSLRELLQFRMSLANDRKSLWSVEVALTLEKAQNAAGIEFARIKVRPTGSLGAEETTAVKDYGKYMQGMIAAQANGGVVVDAPGSGGGLRVAENEEEEAG